MTVRPGFTWWPAVGCTCGARHRFGTRYYVSVIESPDLGPESPMVLALGPFLTHEEARGGVDSVRDVVLSRHNPQGRAHWYGYGTVAMPDTGPPLLGRLNMEVKI